MAASILKLPGVVGVEITEAMLRSHVMRPKDVAQAKGDRGRDTPGARRPAITRPFPPFLTLLDVNSFLKGIEAALGNACVGYSMQLRQQGRVVVSQNYGFAQTGRGASVAWIFNTPMHVASLSKTITAMAMTKLLDHLGLPFTTRISPYLPRYWHQGPNISEITFADLLTHISGLPSEGDTMASMDYELMKAAIAAGVTTHGTYQYADMNFSLCRILLAVLNGNISAGFAESIFFPGWFSGLFDPLWDLITIQAFQNYVATNIFAPAQSAAHLAHQSGDALAYDFPTSSSDGGWNDGDLTTTSGAAGWHMSVNQVLAVLGAFRRSGSIMSPQQAQTMLDSGFGIDWIEATSAGGSYYAKNGFWYDGNGHFEQGVLFFLPEEMEFVVLVNSPVADNAFLYTVVSQVYLDNLAPGPVSAI